MNKIQQTHHEECWLQRRHHDCAVAKIERLTAELQAAREQLLEDTADNERLRVALQEIALDTCNPTNEPHVYAVRAREALAAVEDKT